ncbi:hypothetical protein ACHAXH_003015 [Discostella pseudostelligera]
MATTTRRTTPLHQSRVKLQRYYFIILSSTFINCQIILRTPFIASFQVVPPTPIIDYRTSRRTLINNHSADDDSDKDVDSSVFNANAILGETLDISLHGGKYSWSNPNATTPSVSPSYTRNRYKRIQFPGCGSILLHQQPDSFVEPSTSIDVQGNSGPGVRSRQKGRTGVTLWSASHVISNYIDMQWSKDGDWNKCDNSRWVVLELGAGLGLCSAVAAKHGMDVVSTDNDPTVLSLLKENLQRNQSSKQQVHVHSLDWVTVASDSNAEYTHPAFVQLESLSGVDLILLSDVIYGATQSSWDALLVLLNKLRSQRHRLRVEQSRALRRYSSSVNPIVLLGYTQRRRDMTPQDEARFFAKVHAARMEAVLIPSTCIPHGEKYMLTSLFELRWDDEAREADFV